MQLKWSLHGFRVLVSTAETACTLILMLACSGAKFLRYLLAMCQDAALLRNRQGIRCGGALTPGPFLCVSQQQELAPMSELCCQSITLSRSWFCLSSSVVFGREQVFSQCFFLFFSPSVREQNRHFQKRKKQHDVLFHVITSEISQALSSGSGCNTPLQAALPPNCSHSIFYGQVMCSKRSVTQAIAFLILCLAACNERESTTVFY